MPMKHSSVMQCKQPALHCYAQTIKCCPAICAAIQLASKVEPPLNGHSCLIELFAYQRLGT